MNIKIDENYSITSDDRNVILAESKITQEGKNKGKSYETVIGYYGTVEGALKGYLRIKTNRSESTSIQELMKDVEQIKIIIETVLKGV